MYLLVLCVMVSSLYASATSASTTFVSDNSPPTERPSTTTPPPPPPAEAAKMARYIVHYSDWATVTYNSIETNISGYPSGRIQSMADGPMAMSSGIPFFYSSTLDAGIRTLAEKDARTSVIVTLAENDYCTSKNFDPQDPRCAQVIISGKFAQITPNSSVYHLAKLAMETRHPAMTHWPKDHKFKYFMVKVENVIVLDYFGGAKTLTPQEYFKAIPSDEFIHPVPIQNIKKT